VPGHIGIDANEIADQLARKGSCSHLYDLSQPLGYLLQLSGCNQGWDK